MTDFSSYDSNISSEIANLKDHDQYTEVQNKILALEYIDFTSESASFASLINDEPLVFETPKDFQNFSSFEKWKQFKEENNEFPFTKF